MKGLGNLGGFLKQNYDKVLLGVMLVLMAGGLLYASNVVKTARTVISEAEQKVDKSVPDAKVQDLDKGVFTAVVAFDGERNYDFQIGKSWKAGEEKAKPDQRGRPWLLAFEEQLRTNLPLIPPELQSEQAPLVPRSIVDPPILVYSKDESRHLLHADTMENPYTGAPQACDVEQWVYVLGQKDTDQDGIPDSKEKEFGLDPNSEDDANCDVDGDGFSNLDEFTWDETGATITDASAHPPTVNHLRFYNADTRRLRILLKGINMNNSPTDNRRWQLRLQVPNPRNPRSMASVSTRVGGQIPGTKFRVINAEYREARAGGGGSGVEKSTIQIQEGKNEPITLQLNTPPRTNQILKVYFVHLETQKRSTALLNVPTELETPSGGKETFIVTQDETGTKLFANIGDDKIDLKRVDSEEYRNFANRFAHCDGGTPQPDAPPNGTVAPPR